MRFSPDFPEVKALYLDIKAAYDTVDRRLLWSLFAEIPPDNASRQLVDKTRQFVILLLRCLFDFNFATFLILGRSSPLIPALSGLLQGTVLAPLLFNLYMNSLPNGLRSLAGAPLFRFGGARLNSLLFADDTVIFSSVEINASVAKIENN
ncbi:hypothetical protein HDU67_004716 [Dinochytrium kinnereticum]|nr:hypothetical protein HDU67_004716 [Dinochytrium kinnereticum]